MYDRFRITVRVEPVPALLEFLSQLRKVIDLAVEYDPHAPIFVVNGLVPTGKVDDAKSPHSEADRTFGVDPFVVRTSVNDRLAHAMHFSGIDDLVRSTYDTCNPTHGFTP
jgi:hypothetical protein